MAPEPHAPASILRCPAHGAALREVGAAWSCAAGCSFSVSTAGAIDFGPPAAAFPFDRHVAIYDACTPWLLLPWAFSADPFALRQLWARAAAAAAGGVLVDAACGTARHTVDAAAAHGVRRLVGLDVSMSMLARAAHHARARTQPALLLRHSLEDPLPLGDGCADAVVVSLGLQFVRQRATALAELRRVLAADGVIFGAAPVLGQSRRYDQRHARRGRKDLPFRAGELERVLEQTGFALRRVTRSGALVFWEAGLSPQG